MPDRIRARKSSILSLLPSNTWPSCSKTWQKVFQTSSCRSTSWCLAPSSSPIRLTSKRTSLIKLVNLAKRPVAVWLRDLKKSNRGVMRLRRIALSRLRSNFPWRLMVKSLPSLAAPLISANRRYCSKLSSSSWLKPPYRPVFKRLSKSSVWKL